MENRILDAGMKSMLLRKVSTLPSEIKVYRNKITGCYEVWLRGVYVMDFKHLGSVETKKIGYRFSQHNSRINHEQEMDDFEEYKKKRSDQTQRDMIEAAAVDVHKFGNLCAKSVSVLPKR